ncbi:MAG: aminopeptidase N [Pseudomonadota bacterium]|nr:aminopeptidase N [Pseudomonadota bacterium]
MTTIQPKTIRLADYQPPAYAIDSVALDFDLGADTTRVKSRLAMRAVEGGGGHLVFDGEELELISVALDGRALRPDDYVLTGDSLTIEAPPAAFVLDIETEIRPRENTKLDGLYVSSDVFCTQCEAEGFRRITFFPDRPDVMTVYTTTIRADKAVCPVLLSNGNLTAEADLGGGRHLATWHDPFPKPCYLFALVAGDLACFSDSYTTGSGRQVALRIFVEHGKVERCAYAMDSLKRSMRWDEERFGLEYDLDLFNIVAVSDFNIGAMENKSLNIFNDKYILANPETATDTDYANIEAIVAHEYFHNWTGNRVTCRDWFQLSLKEGLTVFRDQEFSSDMRSRPVKRISDVRMLRAHQFPEDGGPLAHPVRPAAYIEINNFYTTTVYEKGAEVIRMMHTLLGEDGFQKGMRLYFKRHDGAAVTCDDFVAAMADANDADLAQFKLWYSQAGTPEIKVESCYDADGGVFELTISQHCPETPGQKDKAPMHIPLAIGLLDDQGRDMALDDVSGGIINVTEERQTFRFPCAGAPTAVSLNRGFSAPVNVKQAGAAAKSHAFLMTHDSDAFSRWEAGQQFATDLLLAGVSAIQAGDEPSFDRGFIDALGQTLADDTMEKAFTALAVTLPGEGYIAERMDVIDAEAIHRAREGLRRAVAEHLKRPLVETYHGNQSNQPYSPEAGEAGRRALKNAALSFLANLPDHEMTDLVSGQYRAADNMTDRAAAIRELIDMDGPERTAALDDFYDRFADDPLVTDKWMALQAISSLPDTLARVTELLDHPAFAITNPNKVRALVGAFANGNPLRFHAADGSGYEFLADRVLELDAINPQGGARLLTPLGRWRRFDEGRQGHMKGQLERILAKDGLSRNIYEISSKSLK